ncbi:MAG: outer membrane beta-barrel protein [Bacteroidales bacterium]|nr:outer membrane beta-barrel protein [Bacteroidales bacterium]
MKYNKLHTNKTRSLWRQFGYTCLLALLFGLGGKAWGQQPVSISGRVSDMQSGEAMPFVNVALMRTHDTIFMRGATTDPTGRFLIGDVAPGEYLMQVSFVGYETVLETIEVLEKLDKLDIRLRPGTTLAEVEVVADKPLYAMDGEKNMYNTKEDPSIQTGTASDALQNAPGVEVDAEGNITLRGVSSVEIWINDRPSHMNEEALKQYIKQLPANAIERIEVITNPSARYSSKGGVINIVTNQTVKRNEFLSLGFRANTMPSFSPWASYVYANEKFDINVYVNAYHGHHDSYGDGTSALLRAPGDTARYQSHRDTTVSNNFGGYTGVNLNWNISDRTHLATWAGIYPYWGRSHSTVDLDYFEYPSRANLGYRYTHDNDDGFFWGGYLGAWLEHRFDSTGRKLSFSVNGNTSSNGGTSTSSFAYHDPLRDTLFRRDYSLTRNPTIGFNLDYVHPLKHDWELAAGVAASTGGGTERRTLDTMAAGRYERVLLRSHEGVERGTDLDLYATAQKRWGGFTAKVGLRAENAWPRSTWNYADGSGTSVVDTHFFGLVPSLHLSYQTKTFTSYSLSYTLRHANPGSTKLNRFVRYDDYSYETGNPNLLRSYTHNLEAAWSKYIMGFGTVGLNAYWRANTDEIGTMTAAGYAPDYFPASQLVNYTYPDNIGSSHTEGLEASVMYRPTAMFNLRFNASVFNYAYEYQGFSDSKVSWSARLNLWAKLWNKLEVFANAHYSSPRLGLYSLTNANKGIDLGCSADFLDRKLSVYFNVNDIFGMAEWGENTTAPQYQTTGGQRFDSRFVSLGITWRIGKMELESKARQGGSEGTTPQM